MNDKEYWERQAKQQQNNHGAYDYRTKEAERQAELARQREREKQGKKVICTELVKQRRLEVGLYRSCHRYADKRWTRATFAGYHRWAIPLVKAMRCSPQLSRVIAFFAVRRARHVAYRLGEAPAGSVVGSVVAFVVDQGSALLGRFCNDGDYLKLYRDDSSVTSA